VPAIGIGTARWPGTIPDPAPPVPARGRHTALERVDPFVPLDGQGWQALPARVVCEPTSESSRPGGTFAV